MISTIEGLLNRAGVNNLTAPSFFALAVIGSVLVIGFVTTITTSITIALACYLCLVVQVADSIRNRIAKNNLRQQMSWPNYLDAIHSSIWAGASFQEALLDCARHAPISTSWAFIELERDLNSGLDLDASLINLKARLATPIADRFVEITRMAVAMGGNGFLPGLKAQASQLRLENSNWEEINVKQSWVISSARLAVFAPWLILVLLGSRSETAAAFNSQVGLIILLFGLFASLFAFRLVRTLARLPERKRILVSS